MIERINCAKHVGSGAKYSFFYKVFFSVFHSIKKSSLDMIILKLKHLSLNKLSLLLRPMSSSFKAL